MEMQHNHYPKSGFVVSGTGMIAAIEDGLRNDMIVTERAATNDAMIICAHILLSHIYRRFVVIAQAPLPHIPAHIHHTVWRSAIRENAHRAALVDAGVTGVGFCRVV